MEPSVSYISAQGDHDRERYAVYHSMPAPCEETILRLPGTARLSAAETVAIDDACAPHYSPCSAARDEEQFSQKAQKTSSGVINSAGQSEERGEKILMGARPSWQANLRVPRRPDIEILKLSEDTSVVSQPTSLNRSHTCSNSSCIHSQSSIVEFIEMQRAYREAQQKIEAMDQVLQRYRSQLREMSRTCGRALPDNREEEVEHVIHIEGEDEEAEEASVGAEPIPLNHSSASEKHDRGVSTTHLCTEEQVEEVMKALELERVAHQSTQEALAQASDRIHFLQQHVRLLSERCESLTSKVEGSRAKTPSAEPDLVSPSLSMVDHTFSSEQPATGDLTAPLHHVKLERLSSTGKFESNTAEKCARVPLPGSPSSSGPGPSASAGIASQVHENDSFQCESRLPPPVDGDGLQGVVAGEHPQRAFSPPPRLPCAEDLEGNQVSPELIDPEPFKMVNVCHAPPAPPPVIVEAGPPRKPQSCPRCVELLRALMDKDSQLVELGLQLRRSNPSASSETNKQKKMTD